IPAKDIQVEEGDTDTAPYGLGTYASRSTPVAGAAAAMAARKIRDKARKIAAHLLEAAEEDLVWEPGRFSVKGAPGRAKTIQGPPGPDQRTRGHRLPPLPNPPPGDGGGPRSRPLLRPAEPDLSVRKLRLRRGRRPWHRRGQGPPLRGGG